MSAVPPFAHGDEVLTLYFDRLAPPARVKVKFVEADPKCVSGWRVWTEAVRCPECGTEKWYELRADSEWFTKVEAKP